MDNNDNIDVKCSQPKVMKMLSENKLKRLNILTFINDKKEILFTKKAYKFEKERIWREIFEMMRDSGMVSAEKDWRYVRDVSFSNWRKRAQKRLKHLAANGYRLNMDECEFLISDILGQTPDKSMIKKMQNDFNKQQQQPIQISNTNGCSAIINENGDNDDDEEENDDGVIDEEVMNESDDDIDDEYMIDSDEEEDSEYLMNEMLFIPKVVINDHPLSNDCLLTNKSTTATVINQKNQSNNSVNGTTTTTTTKSSTAATNKNLDHQYEYQNEQRLLELEIENKILKNRYMKLKIMELEKNLGFDHHCEQVKDLLQQSSSSSTK